MTATIEYGKDYRTRCGWRASYLHAGKFGSHLFDIGGVTCWYTDDGRLIGRPCPDQEDVTDLVAEWEEVG